MHCSRRGAGGQLISNERGQFRRLQPAVDPFHHAAVGVAGQGREQMRRDA